ncbi:FHA domain-containing protein (plasmid) [Scytonema sp. HK-05]|nr:FHA domain-containing protein [Scytonema sp. HK-05]
MTANRCPNPSCEFFNRILPNNAKVCPMCGTPLGNVVPPPSAENQTPSAERQLPEAVPSAKSPASSPPYQAPPPQPAPSPPAYQAPPPPQPAPSPPAYQAPPPPHPASSPPAYQAPPPQQPASSPPAYQAPPPQQPAPSPPAYQAPAASLAHTPPPHLTAQPTLKLIHSSGKEFRLHGEEGYIGRQSTANPALPEIDLSGIPNEGIVSRSHARVYWDKSQNAYMLVDNNSRNGTYLNDKFLSPSIHYRLNHKDSLQLGQERLVCFTVSLTDN